MGWPVSIVDRRVPVGGPLRQQFRSRERCCELDSSQAGCFPAVITHLVPWKHPKCSRIVRQKSRLLGGSCPPTFQLGARGFSNLESILPSRLRYRFPLPYEGPVIATKSGERGRNRIRVKT
jgi:hypothetical protein